MTRSRAFSLLEIIVSSGLMMALLASMATALVAGLRIHRRIEAQTEMETQALLVMSHLRRDIGESAFASMAAQTNGLVFMVPREADGSTAVDSQGRLAWTKLVCYRLDSQGSTTRLVRQEQMLASPRSTPGSPLSLIPPASVASFETNESTLPMRVISTMASGLEVQLTPMSQSTRGLAQLDVKFSTTVNNRNYGLESKFRITPRNS